MSKPYKVSESLYEYVTNILKRRGIKYTITENNNQKYCESNLSGEQFHKIVLRAKMEKLTDEKKSSIPFVATVELNNPVVMDEVGEQVLIADDIEK